MSLHQQALGCPAQSEPPHFNSFPGVVPTDPTQLLLGAGSRLMVSQHASWKQATQVLSDTSSKLRIPSLPSIQG